MTVELVPAQVRFAPDTEVELEIIGPSGPAQITVRHFGASVLEVPAAGPGIVNLGRFPPGGYGAALTARDGTPMASTALDVTDPRWQVLRYGFISDYRPDRPVGDVVHNMRRLHLTDVQFYDWAYRHADLVGGGADYTDALGQPVSLGTVRALIEALHHIGARALGYAAVYAVGHRDWPAWASAALLAADGLPYGLGGFLQLVDPADQDWLTHLRQELRSSLALGFDGFHLDQYGYPKYAMRPDGRFVDVAASFAAMIQAVRDELPQARLIFNQVNDFPTWLTALSPQDAVYVEPWNPQVTLADLVDTVERARAAGAASRSWSRPINPSTATSPPPPLI